MKRRIVQISAAPGIGGYSHRLYALADDGTLWLADDPQPYAQTWHRIPEPQDGAA